MDRAKPPGADHAMPADVTRADRPSGTRSRGRSILGYALVAAAVWLGWEALKVPVIDRAPPALGLRLSPGSPSLLRRAAEDELLAQEWDDAAFLADQSLSEAPFNARALRVRGLAAARTGNLEQADELLTLAGNWSLRDDPAHAWLVEHRLRQGSYASAFAHADTLARRRRDLQEEVFNLFTTAAIQDPRATPHLVRLLAATPPWRRAYLDSLQRRDDGDALLLSLGVSLQSTSARLSDGELSQIFRSWAAERRFSAARLLRERLQRPPLEPAVQNGRFSEAADAQIQPFGWSFPASAGLVTQIIEDDLQEGNTALRVDHDGYTGRTVAVQLLLLSPGRYTLAGRYRPEIRSEASLEWALNCVEGGDSLILLRVPGVGRTPATGWSPLSGAVDVPLGCTAQYLVLSTRPSDRRSPLVMWFDDIEIRGSPAAEVME